jgi:hypothetical protein
MDIAQRNYQLVVTNLCLLSLEKSLDFRLCNVVLQSLSEAFVRFLENESRPQLQLRLLPEAQETTQGDSRSVSMFVGLVSTLFMKIEKKYDKK